MPSHEGWDSMRPLVGFLASPSPQRVQMHGLYSAPAALATQGAVWGHEMWISLPAIIGSPYAQAPGSL